MPRLSKPLPIGRFVFHGVDDWLAFAIDRDGHWVQFQTECSPCWRMLPACFIGRDGYPDTAEGVLATAILEVGEGYQGNACNVDYVVELAALFLPDGLPRQCAAVIHAAERDGIEIRCGNVVDLCADNCAASLGDIRQALVDAGLSRRFPRATEELPTLADILED